MQVKSRTTGFWLSSGCTFFFYPAATASLFGSFCLMYIYSFSHFSDNSTRQAILVASSAVEHWIQTISLSDNLAIADQGWFWPAAQCQHPEVTGYIKHFKHFDANQNQNPSYASFWKPNVMSSWTSDPFCAVWKRLSTWTSKAKWKQTVIHQGGLLWNSPGVEAPPAHSMGVNHSAPWAADINTTLVYFRLVNCLSAWSTIWDQND